MKKKLQRLSRRYQAAIRNHLDNGARVFPKRTADPGKRTVPNRFRSIDLAKIRIDSLIGLLPAGSSEAANGRIVKRANRLLSSALIPVEKMQADTLRYVDELRRANSSLSQRTLQLSASNLLLKREIGQRKKAEESLKKSEKKQITLLNEARQMQIRLRHLSHQILSAQEEERKEISRELHDEIVQILTGINVQLASLKIESGLSKESFSKHISSTQRLVEKSVNIVHRFARNLRPTLLDDLGLIPALLSYMKGFTARSGLRVRFLAFAEVERLSNEKRTVLFRVAQAALINVAQHAHANEVSLTLKELPKSVLMEIKDDGISFNAGHLLDSKRNKRLGIIGMRERVEMVGGKFSIESKPGSGTTISAVLPFKRG